MEFTLLGAALTGAVTVWIAVQLLQRSDRLDPRLKGADVLIGAAALGVFAGRVVEMIGAGVNPLTHPADVLLVRGGVNTAAASLAAVGMVAWTYRSDLTVLDRLAPAAVAGLAGWHAGCLWTGSCLGTASGSLPGGTLPNSDIVRHPTELYAAGLLAAAAWGITRLHRRWTPTAAAIGAAAGIRLVTEPIRPSIGGGPVWFYATVSAIGLVALIVSATRQVDGHPPPGSLLDGDGTAVSLHDPPGDGEPESGTAGA